MSDISLTAGRYVGAGQGVPRSLDLTRTLVLGLGAVGIGVDAFVVAGLIPSMTGTLRVSPAEAGQSITVFVLTYAVLAPILAAATARLPRRTLLLGSLLVLASANVGSALAPTLPVLIGGRLLAAAGAAAYPVAAGSIIAARTAPRDRARELVAVVGGVTVAAALGASLGESAHWVGWRAVLCLVSMLCLLAGVGVLLTVPADVPGESRGPLGMSAGPSPGPGAMAVLPLSVLGMVVTYTAYAFAVPALRASGAHERTIVVMLLAYAVGAALINVRSGPRRVAEERLRIARELHDSLTHNLSIIKVQAGVAVHLARNRGEEVPGSLLAIQEASGEAMRELRATLRILRSPGANPLTGGLDRLAGLLERASSAGLAATVTVTGRRRTLPPEVDHTAYRIVQEALTNVTRHAGGAPATVHIGYEPATLRIRVDDDGQVTRSRPPTPGTGLIGMHERVAALGGRLRTGPRPGGGFTVEAELPALGPGTGRAGGALHTALSAADRIGLR